MTDVDRIAALLRQHRVNYHQRNVGPEPVTADNLRYTSCEGCDWLGGHHDETGWERHIAALLTELPAGSDIVTRFNAAHPVGSLVDYWPGVRTGEPRRGITRSAAWLLGGHTPVVLIDGQPGAIALTHIRIGES